MNSAWQSSQLPAGVTHRILLVRHGETAHSARGLCYGKLDVALSPTGFEQAAQTAQLIKSFKPQAIYSSPRLRALDTAAAINTACGLDVIIDDNLAELDFGDFEGLSYEEAELKYPDLYQQWMMHPTNIQFPNGESYAQMSDRVIEFVTQLASSHIGQTIVTVAHGGVNRIVLAQTLGLKSEWIFRLEQSYGAINCIDYYDDTPVLRTMNWVPDN